MSDSDQNNDDKLFESIRQGNIDAYEMLFKKYYLSMCMIARRIVEDEDTAGGILSYEELAAMENENASVRNNMLPDTDQLAFVDEAEKLLSGGQDYIYRSR